MNASCLNQTSSWNSIDVCISVWLSGTTKGSLWDQTWERRSSQKRRGIRHQSGRKRIGLVPCPLFGGCTHETVILISYDSQIDGWSIKWLFESVNEQVKEIIINQGLGPLTIDPLAILEGNLCCWTGLFKHYARFLLLCTSRFSCSDTVCHARCEKAESMRQ